MGTETVDVVKTGFLPGVDTFPPTSWLVLEVSDADRIRCLLTSAMAGALRHLKPRFGAMLDRLGAPEALAEWIEGDAAGASSLRVTRSTFVSLDYYYSATLVPRAVPTRDRAWRLTPSREMLRPYLIQRCLAELAMNARRLLVWMALLHQLPERWLPESFLIEPIHRELARLGFGPATVLDLDLRLPVPGGERWLRQGSQRQWRKLRLHLDAGRPWPIRVLGRQTSVLASPPLIAHGYENRGDDTGVLLVCDGESPEREFAIAVDARPTSSAPVLRWGGRWEGRWEGDWQGEMEGEAPGFFCEVYTPLTPPSTRLGRCLRCVPPWRALWWLTRHVRARHLAHRGASMRHEGKGGSTPRPSG
jgi:hypothetical protein